VLRWCGRLGAGRVDAEDAAQDVFVLVFQRLGSLREPSAFPCWLFKVTRGVIARRRRSGLLFGFLPRPGVSPPPPEDPLARAERSEEARIVLVVLDELPAILREVLVLCLMESRSESEVAALVDVPLGTVKSRLRRAREAFIRRARRRGLADPAPIPFQKEGTS
jgi:RNA polymerase sigma-70 factor (ECF subfamily)